MIYMPSNTKCTRDYWLIILIIINIFIQIYIDVNEYLHIFKICLEYFLQY